MYSPHQNPQMLPFDPQRPQGAYLNIQLGQPPVVPAVTRDPQMQQILPLVCSMLVLDIQGMMNNNALRMFMFNQMSVNNYANDEFAGLAEVTVNVMTLGLMKRQFMNLEDAARDTVPKVLEMITCANLRRFPQLEQFIDPNTQHHAYNMIRLYDSIAQEVARMMAPAQQQPQQMYQPAGGSNWPASHMVGGGGFTAGSLVKPSVGTGTLFGRGQQQQPTTSEHSGRIMDRYSNRPTLAQPFQARQPVAAPAPVAEAPIETALPFEEAPTKVAPAGLGVVNWKPSAEFPYQPAYHPSTHVLYLELKADGTVHPIPDKRTDNVDYDKHALTVFGPVPKPLQLEKKTEVLERLQAGVDAINGVQQTRSVDGQEVVEPTVELSTVIKPNFVAETSESTAWLMGSLERLKQGDTLPDVYRVYAQIAEPTVSLQDETSYLAKYADSSTFMELREKLDSSVNAVSAGLWGIVNQRMTRLVNRILRQNLGIPKLSIESFTSDYKELLDYLGTTWGDMVLGKFLQYQAKHIQGTLCTLDDVTAKGLADLLIDEKDFASERKPKVTYISSNYSLTYLNCRAHELDLQLSPDAAAAVTRQLTPLLYELVEGLFENSDERAEEGVAGKPMVIERHLLRTTDGRVMEAARGYLAEGAYVLTLID